MYYFHHFEAGDFEHSGSRIEFDSYDDARKALIEMVTLTKTISVDDIENWTIKNTENDDDNGYIDVSDLDKTKREIERDDINKNIVLVENGSAVGEYSYENAKDWLITMFNYTVTDDLRSWKVGGSEDDETGWTPVSDEMILLAIKA